MKPEDVLISIRPRYTGEILSGAKGIEVRKNRPKQEPPFRCYIYETQGKTEIPWMDEDGHMIFRGRGTVVAEFTCDRIDIFTTVTGAKHECTISDEAMHRGSCLTEKELHDYEFSAPPQKSPYSFGLFGWHISNLKEYEKPRQLSDFGLNHPPQSWCYIHVDETGRD